jgi:cell division protein FtsL
MSTLSRRWLIVAFSLSMALLLATAFAALQLLANLQHERQTNARLLEIVRKHDARHLEYAAYYHSHHKQGSHS